tara:strand:+ start:948 stop:1154 length:207 start_codon:yes stop_codon:yes gene_type:complete
MDNVIDDIVSTIHHMDAEVEQFFFRNGNDRGFIVLALWEALGFSLAERYEYDEIGDAVKVMLKNPSVY